MFANTLKDQGLEVRFVDPSDPENFRRATDARTRAYYAETLPNPKLAVFPIAEVAAIGRAVGIPLIMDNTAAPILVPALRPWRGDHRLFNHQIHRRAWDVDWRRDHRRRQFRLGGLGQRQPALNTPDPSYHGAVWTQAVKPHRSRGLYHQGAHDVLRDLGAAASPFNSFLTLQGLETLPLRMECHCANAPPSPPFWRSARRHQGDPSVGADRRATAPAPTSICAAARAALLGFELAGGAVAGRRFIDALQMFYHVANIGDARSLAIHPASTTHSQLAEEAQIATGVSPGYVRLSIGLEHIDDILADLEQALTAAG